MRWTRDGDTMSATGPTSAYVKIENHAGNIYTVRLWNEDTGEGIGDAVHRFNLADAQAAALALMRAEVIAARDEAENAVLDASRWLRANGGEP